MQDAAIDLIRNGARKAIALLTYARLAYGAAGGYGAEISLEDAEKALRGVYGLVKADLDVAHRCSNARPRKILLRPCSFSPMRRQTARRAAVKCLWKATLTKSGLPPSAQNFFCRRVRSKR